MEPVKYNKGELPFAIICFVVAVTFFIASISLKNSADVIQLASVKIMPLLLSVIMLYTSIKTIWEAYQVRKKSTEAVDVFQKRIAIYIISSIVYVIAMFYLPFWLSSMLFLLFSYYYWEAFPLLKGALISIAIVEITIIVFSKLFQINF